MCRCAKSRQGEGYDRVKLEEIGKGAWVFDGPERKCKRQQSGPGAPLKWASSGLRGNDCKPLKFGQPIRVAKNEKAIQRAILHSGPVVAGFEVYEDLMEFRGDGIYRRKAAKKEGGHAIVLFGWGIEGNKKFWWAKNSWGEDWPKGQPSRPGIFKVVRGENMDDIEDDVVMVFPPGQEEPDNGRCPQAKKSEVSGCIKLERNPAKQTCTVRNICAGKKGIIQSYGWQMKYERGGAQCGRGWGEDFGLPSSQYWKQPVQREETFESVVDCCLMSTTPVGSPLKKVPNECISGEKSRWGNCLLSNKCGRSVRLYTDVDSGRYFDFPANEKDVNLRGADAICSGTAANAYSDNGGSPVDVNPPPGTSGEDRPSDRFPRPSTPDREEDKPKPVLPPKPEPVPPKPEPVPPKPEPVQPKPQPSPSGGADCDQCPACLSRELKVVNIRGRGRTEMCVARNSCQKVIKMTIGNGGSYFEFTDNGEKNLDKEACDGRCPPDPVQAPACINAGFDGSKCQVGPF